MLLDTYTLHDLYRPRWFFRIWRDSAMWSRWVVGSAQVATSLYMGAGSEKR